ncbi:LysR family transcriptional regulator [Paraburkholderia sp. DHOC27]|uniref:LysR family transcriptional regulator n=1 Tax=Paraburkholderia sp. DHOC27 TaxID=2303330 RepID=UPI000E3B9B6F|nr:LysR family transcriptional regulator [Paraburkholderia sp. DHOC27]RFU45049.1 LysR family transcriptional regulator [Paraburkholderia sp. DHOC27]
MTSSIQADDLAFFSVLASRGSLTAAARELGLSTAAVSKHLAQMELRAGVALVNRTTRRMSLTPEGEVYLAGARRVLDEIEQLEQSLGGARVTPKGLLRVNATLGFGRSHVAPVISRFVREFPQVDVQLELSVDPPPLGDDSYDICVRFGEPPDARVIARRIAPNRRLLCAAPAYLAKHRAPQLPADLALHNCIGIRQGSDGYGVWRLTRDADAAHKTESVRVRSNLTTNDGEIAVRWALDGHGILMRAEWDIRGYLRDGTLVQVLPEYRTAGADIYAVYAPQHQASARVRAFIDFLSASLTESVPVTANSRRGGVRARRPLSRTW